jgi:hypothetical protein
VTPTAPADEAPETPTIAAATLDALAARAASGRLQRAGRAGLEAVPHTDPAYVRSRALLVMDAQQAGDHGAEGAYLDQLMAVPESGYDPVFLAQHARWLVNDGQYAAGLDAANTAEQHWARIPSDILQPTRAQILRTRAAAAQGVFYESGGDLPRLDAAISAWQRYATYVARLSADDGREATAVVARLEDTRARLQ